MKTYELYFDKDHNSHEGVRERIIEQGEYKGFNYKIVSYGTHPCAYIQLPEESELRVLEYNDISLSCHGGLTYGVDSEGWIGWDYTHAGDYSYYPSIEIKFPRSISDKVWTKEEILEEIKEVIEQIPKLKKFQVNKFYYSEEEEDWRS